jgi:flagellar protein FliL
VADNANSNNAENGKPGSKFDVLKLLTFVLVGMNVVTVGGSAAVIYKIKMGTKPATITEVSESLALDVDRELRDSNPVLLSFEPFTANLDGHPRKLVRATIQMEMLSEEGYEEAVNKTPLARDQIIRILNGKHFEDIESVQGKLFLKDQILTSMNNLLHKGTVKEVYFNEFVVQ